MLISLRIENFTVIQQSTLKPHRQLTAITGETGAGKSVLVDALTLLQGARADKNHIQAGQQHAVIEGHFDISNTPSAKQWLEHNGLLNGNTCTLTRVLDQNGKSRSTINGQTCTLQTLKSFGQQMIRIHAQHQYHTLLDREYQLTLLDRYAELETTVSDTQHLYHQWRKTVSRIEHAEQHSHTAQQRLDLLTYQIQELRQIDISIDTLRAHYAQHERLNKAEATLSLCHKLRETINSEENGSLMSLSQTAQRLLNNNNNTHITALKEIAKLLDEQHILLEECLSHLNDAEQQIEIDPEQLAALDNYLDTLNTLARKHRTTPEALDDLAQTLEKEQQELESTHLNRDALYAAEREHWLAYRAHAEQLSQRRQAAAVQLGETVTHYLQSLGMKDSRIEFTLNPDSSSTKDATDSTSPSPLDALNETQLKACAGPNGFDEGELLISNHPKLPCTPLKKTASGGELSRVSLALFMITEKQPGATLIFDEVDTGMGGETGDLLGTHLQSISQDQQILCVTHLPQVAARAHRHVHIIKNSDENKVTSTAQTLNLKARKKELERMLGLSSLRDTLLLDTATTKRSTTRTPPSREAKKALSKAALKKTAHWT